MINPLKDISVEGLVIKRYDTKRVSDQFKYREFILEVNSQVDNQTWIDYLSMRLLQERTDLLDDVRCGYRLMVTFRITGRKWKKKDTNEEIYFTNLEALNLEILDDSNNFEKDIPVPEKKEKDDIIDPEAMEDDVPF